MTLVWQYLGTFLVHALAHADPVRFAVHGDLRAGLEERCGKMKSPRYRLTTTNARFSRIKPWWRVQEFPFAISVVDLYRSAVRPTLTRATGADGLGGRWVCGLTIALLQGTFSRYWVSGTDRFTVAAGCLELMQVGHHRCWIPGTDGNFYRSAISGRAHHVNEAGAVCVRALST